MKSQVISRETIKADRESARQLRHYIARISQPQTRYCVKSIVKHYRNGAEKSVVVRALANIAETCDDRANDLMRVIEWREYHDIDTSADACEYMAILDDANHIESIIAVILR